MAGAQPVLAAVGVLLDELLLLERAEQPVDGRLRDPEAIRDLGDAEPRRAPQRLAGCAPPGRRTGSCRGDPLADGDRRSRRTTDGALERAEDQRGRCRARILMPDAPRARGRTPVPSAPASAASPRRPRSPPRRRCAPLRPVLPPARNVRSNAGTAGSHASTIVLSPGCGRPQRLDPLEAGPERRQEHLAVGRSGLGDASRRSRRNARTEERARGASDPVDQRLAHLLEERAGRSVGRRLQAWRRRRRTRVACSPRGRRRRSPRPAG